MRVNLTRHGCAPTGVVSALGTEAPETRVSLGPPLGRYGMITALVTRELGRAVNRKQDFFGWPRAQQTAPRVKLRTSGASTVACRVDQSPPCGAVRG